MSPDLLLGLQCGPWVLSCAVELQVYWTLSVLSTVGPWLQLRGVTQDLHKRDTPTSVPQLCQQGLHALLCVG